MRKCLLLLVISALSWIPEKIQIGGSLCQGKMEFFAQGKLLCGIWDAKCSAEFSHEFLAASVFM